MLDTSGSSGAPTLAHQQEQHHWEMLQQYATFLEEVVKFVTDEEFSFAEPEGWSGRSVSSLQLQRVPDLSEDLFKAHQSLEQQERQLRQLQHRLTEEGSGEPAMEAYVPSCVVVLLCCCCFGR